MRRFLRFRVAAIAIAAGLLVLSLSVPAKATVPYNMCLHSTQGLHEISAPDSWPGTRAAHQVWRFEHSVSHTVYTKSGWWDPTWDYYYSRSYACP